MRWLMTTILILAAVATTPGNAGEGTSGGRRFDRKVSKTPSVVYLKGFNSATQKGPTCNVYSMWMILHYYKLHISPARIKKGAKDGEYKTSKFIEDKLDTVDFCFLYYYPKQGTDFGEAVKVCIDNGIPLQWGCNLKYAPNAKASRNRVLRDGGHARVIWGYERDRRTGIVTKIIFADSWGFKKLRQKMEVDEACHMTMSMHPVFPKDTDPAVVAKLLAVPGMKQGKVKFDSEGRILPEKTPAPPVADKPGKKPARRPKKNR